MRRRTLAILLATLGLAAGSAGEDLNRWDSIGPDAAAPGNYVGPVGAIAVDPRNPAILYAGISRGLYKTEDGGTTWRQLLQDRVPSSIPANPTYWAFTLIAIDPADPDIVLAASGGGSVFRSANAGESWLTVLSTQGVASLDATPGGPALACGTQSGRLATFSSVDSGLTWTEVAPLAGKAVQAFAASAANPGRIWAAVAGDPAGAVVYFSDDSGASWAPRSAGLPSALSTTLALAPDAPETLYVSTDAGLFRTSDGGQAWAPVGPGLPQAPVTALAAGPGLSVYAGTHLEGLYRSRDGGAAWTATGFRGSALFTVVLDPSRPGRVYAGGNGTLLRITIGPVETCAAGVDALCLQGERFLVRSSWRRRHDAGVGQALPLTSDTGAFWFFDPDNVEVTLKVLDGRSYSGAYWVFFGALSNVEYVITVVDGSTGAIQSYFNYQGVMASVADTSAFPTDSSGPAAAPTAGTMAPTPRAAAAAACVAGPYALCLQGGRFQVEVAFTRTPLGPSAPAPAVSMTADTGYFWFFDPANVELVVKVLDGRGVNGHFWVFYGALSDVQYQVVVTDSVTGERRTYENERGNLASVADTSAF